ncbi:hypothetical protein [Georgenia daeguensis]|uniref:Uncharacterized protein n=1 Tax=Georgenia daeguensis TaxID=908355 RepID=A0ABP6UKY3_9MICO
MSAFFQLLNGVAFLMVGLAMVLGRTFPRWLGWVGVIAGLGAFPGSVVVAYTGFSVTAALVLQPAAVRCGLPGRDGGGHVAQSPRDDGRCCLT